MGSLSQGLELGLRGTQQSYRLKDSARPYYEEVPDTQSPFNWTIRKYLTEAQRNPILTKEQITEIYKRIEYCKDRVRAYSHRLSTLSSGNGLEAAIQRRIQMYKEQIQEERHKVVCANLKFVVTVARRYIGWDLSLSDLIEEGNIGLFRAVEKFDYNRGNSFSTYAGWWIKQSISRAIEDKGRTIRVSSQKHQEIRNIRGAIDDLQRQQREDPTTEEIAARVGLHPEQVERLLIASERPCSLEELANEHGNINIPDKTANDPWEYAVRLSLRRNIARSLQALTPQERVVIVLRLGLDGQLPCTLNAIGNMYGRTRERIRQIQAGALKKLREDQETIEDLLPFWIDKN